MSKGVIYMAWGENAVKQAHYSMMSLWQYESEMPVMVLGDQQAGHYYERINKVTFQKVDVDPFNPDRKHSFKFLAGRIKPLMAKLSPWEQTLYVDADSKFKQSPQPGFDLLDRWDLAIACHTKGVGGTNWTNFQEREETSVLIGSPHVLYHNSGMIFWRKNERTDKLFDLWYDEWLIYEHWDEQVALLRALLKSDVVYRNLPLTWNHCDKKKAYILYHQFGSGFARTEKLNTVVEKVEKIKIVKVELSPGVWVRCEEGKEQKILDQLKRGKR